MYQFLWLCKDPCPCHERLNINTCCYLLQPPPGSISSPEQQEQLTVQLERIHTLFRRQLAIPLMGKEATSLSVSFKREDSYSFKTHSHILSLSSCMSVSYSHWWSSSASVWENNEIMKQSGHPNRAIVTSLLNIMHWLDHLNWPKTKLKSGETVTQWHRWYTEEWRIK